MIELRQVSKVFPTAEGELRALSDINLTIQDGDVFGIVGMSGAGKSTLVRCINLLERPTQGQVLIDGKDLCNLSEKELILQRRSIAMIFQQFNLLMQRTCLKNICFPMEIAGVRKDEARKRALEYLDIVGLPDKADAYPAQLSGGQKQRIAIARALASDPKILLCDEATSALDPKTTRDILRLVKDINRRLGITVVVITHEMAVVEEICTHVAILDHGVLQETGTVEEIFSNPQTEAGRRLVYPDGDPRPAESGQRHPHRLQRRLLLRAPHRLPGHRLRGEGQHSGGGHPERQRPGLRHHAAGPARRPGADRQGDALHQEPAQHHGGGGAGLPWMNCSEPFSATRR